MTKLSKTIKCLILSGLLLGANCQKVEAFGFFPPMPGEPSFDGVNNAGKVAQVAQEGYHTIKSGFSFDKAIGLLGAKSLIELPWKQDSKDIDKKGKLKTPGRGGVQANSTLKIEADDVNENNYVNAFHTLFFTYDFSNSPAGVSESEFKTLYRRKAVEFKQDMAIDTYVTAKVMEDYLAIIDETLSRLEQCQNGKITDDCTFFGMTMEKVEADSMTPPTEGNTENAAQLGAARNAYIVTTVQDRLLRIIEELTSLEAIFQASRQIDIAEPINTGEAQSSAEDYLPKTYQFAYNNSYDFVAAKGTPAIKFNNRIKKCDGKSKDPNCPAVNKKKAEINIIEDTELLSKLPTIEKWVDSAVAIHNLKSMMHQYKTQYRQYLLQKKIHDDAKNLVKNSDKCVVDFLNRHSNINNAQQIWYGGSEPVGNKRFDYENRRGISGDLIKAYDNASADIAIGTSDECRGYYETNACPAGYTYNNEKCCESNSSLCACEVALITEDISGAAERTRLDGNPLEAPAPTKVDTDSFIDGTNAERLEKATRNSVELTWNLGKEALLNAMRNPNNKLTFKPWNDQKILQEEYLRNKYRNIKMIAESTDQGVASFKLSSKRAGEYKNPDNLEKYIKAAASCLGKSEAEAAAKQRHCTGSYVSCTANYNAGMVKTTVTRRVGTDDDGNPIYNTETYNDSQKASLGSGCTYTKAVSDINTSNPDICLTPQCLVNNYFPKRWPSGVDGFYNEAQGKGRLVAVNKLEAVIQERQAQEVKVYNLVHSYQNKIAAQEDKVRRSIANLENTNKSINDLNKKKNFVADELRRTDKRIDSITNEIKALDARKQKLTNEKDKKAIEDKKAELAFEQKCINGEKSATATFKTNRKKNEKEKVVLTCNDYITTLSARENNKDENKYASDPTKIEREVELLDKQVTAQKDRLDVLKSIVSSEQDALADLKDEFATNYLAAENDAQEAIEEKNVEYERFLDANMDDGYSTYKNKGEKKPYRMRNNNKTECYQDGFIGIGCKKKGPQRIKENNLSASITTFIQNGDLNSAMKKELNNTFFSSMAKINSMLSGLGIPSSFAVDGTFSEIGLSGTGVTPVQLAEAVKNKVVEFAAKDLTNIIDTADKDIEKAIDEATNEVKKYAKDHNIDGESNTMPDEDYLMTPSADHQGLLQKLRSISDRFTGEGVDNLLGIPSDDTFNAMEDVKNNIDDSYFVALPARGNNYRNIKADDKNAGRDYIAPKDMLSSIPPLREVFYFNAADYDELPRKDGKPVITELLQCKYYNDAKGVCETEYLPEVWLHLLARPNLREDHKYWQTFVERSFGGNAQLSKLVQNKIANAAIIPAPKDSDYRAIIGRAGVYPCKAGNKYIDINGGDNVGDMRFKSRNTLPSGVPVVSCQEVSVSGNTVTHLLADHKKGKNTDKENLGTTNEPMYDKHSELGQLLTKDLNSEDLKYRPLQENIQKFLLNTDEPENDITRQKAERASFKRNIMGSFLDAMTTEYNARKNLEQSKKAIANTLKSLCEQFDSLEFAGNKPVIKECNEFLNAADELPVELTDVNKETVVDKIRLAADYTEKDYYEINGAYKGIVCPANGQDAYKAIFCALDAEKDNLVQKAQQKLSEAEKKMGNSSNGKAYVAERLDKIKDYIDKTKGSLIIDKDEVTTIRPGTTPAVETGRADREVEIETAEEGIESMANQSQSVAYCPIY